MTAAPSQHRRSKGRPPKLAGVVASLLAVFSAQLAPAGATYHFSSQGWDGNDGSIERPLQTIYRLNELNLEPGDSVLFRAGDTFTGKMWLDGNDSGIELNGSVNPIRISSYGAAGNTTRATITSFYNEEAFVSRNAGGIELSNLDFVSGGFANTADTRRNGVYFLNDSAASPSVQRFPHIRVNDITSRGFGRSGLSVWSHYSVGYDDVRISNSEFSGNGYAGVYVGATEYWNKYHTSVVVDGVTAHDNPGFTLATLPYTGHGVIMANTDGGVIQNSVAYGNGAVGGNANVGIWTYQSNAVTIQHNVAYGNRSAGPYDGGAFDIDGGVTNSVIQYNRSWDNDGAGLLLAEYQPTNGMSHNVFRYNLSVNDGRGQYGGISIAGAAANSVAKDAVFHNNTIVVDRAVVPQSKGAVWFIGGNHDDIVFANNAFVALNGAPLIAGDTSTSKSSFIGNSYWTGGATPKLEDTAYGTVEAWSLASGQERSGASFAGITADPQFYNTGDYRPMAASPLVDAGRGLNHLPFPAWLANLGGLGSVDLNSVLLFQGSNPDIGAWERLPGDFNSNGRVDGGDLSVWASAYGASGAAGAAADLDGDGDTDGDDLLRWQTLVGSGVLAPPSSSVPAPEPTGVAVMAAALAALLGLRRRRHHA